MRNTVKLLIFSVLLVLMAVGFTGCGGDTEEKVVFYTNSDEEAQAAMKHALDKNGFEGKYIMQSFATSELGGKLMAEGKNIEADLLTMSSYYLDSTQQANGMFADLTFDPQALAASSKFYAPVLGNTGALFVNTEVMAKHNLPMPKAIKDLTNPVYKGFISIPDIMGSSTAWLLTQAVFDAYGEQEGAKIMKAIAENAGAHLESSGSGPLKKLRAGEAAIGFGLRHQAVADKKKGLPIDYIDPAEGNFILTESIAVVNKNEKKNALAMKMAEVILKNGRSELLQYYPVALYAGETVAAENMPAGPKQYKEPLTVDLLKKHQTLLK